MKKMHKYNKYKYTNSQIHKYTNTQIQNSAFWERLQLPNLLRFVLQSKISTNQLKDSYYMTPVRLEVQNKEGEWHFASYAYNSKQLAELIHVVYKDSKKSWKVTVTSMEIYFQCLSIEVIAQRRKYFDTVSFTGFYCMYTSFIHILEQQTVKHTFLYWV